jgi:purine-binding chemotaxis protein CheW
VSPFLPEPAASGPVTSPGAQLCTFRVGSQEYAIDIMRVREIIPPVPLTPVPAAPAHVLGVFRLRDDVIPVIDLARRLGLPSAAPSRRTKFIVVRVAGRLIGLQVDEVREVLRLEREDLVPAPPALEGGGARLFLGVCGGERGAGTGRRAGAGRLRLLLNVKALLDPAAGGSLESARALLAPGAP